MEGTSELDERNPRGKPRTSPNALLTDNTGFMTFPRTDRSTMNWSNLAGTFNFDAEFPDPSYSPVAKDTEDPVASRADEVVQPAADVTPLLPQPHFGAYGAMSPALHFVPQQANMTKETTPPRTDSSNVFHPVIDGVAACTAEYGHGPSPVTHARSFDAINSSRFDGLQEGSEEYYAAMIDEFLAKLHSHDPNSLSETDKPQQVDNTSIDPSVDGHGAPGLREELRTSIHRQREAFNDARGVQFEGNPWNTLDYGVSNHFNPPQPQYARPFPSRGLNTGHRALLPKLPQRRDQHENNRLVKKIDEFRQPEADLDVNVITNQESFTRRNGVLANLNSHANGMPSSAHTFGRVSFGQSDTDKDYTTSQFQVPQYDNSANRLFPQSEQSLGDSQAQFRHQFTLDVAQSTEDSASASGNQADTFAAVYNPSAQVSMGLPRRMGEARRNIFVRGPVVKIPKSRAQEQQVSEHEGEEDSISSDDGITQQPTGVTDASTHAVQVPASNARAHIASGSPRWAQALPNMHNILSNSLQSVNISITGLTDEDLTQMIVSTLTGNRNGEDSIALPLLNEYQNRGLGYNPAVYTAAVAWLKPNNQSQNSTSSSQAPGQTNFRFAKPAVSEAAHNLAYNNSMAPPQVKRSVRDPPTGASKKAAKDLPIFIAQGPPVKIPTVRKHTYRVSEDDDEVSNPSEDEEADTSDDEDSEDDSAGAVQPPVIVRTRYLVQGSLDPPEQNVTEGTSGVNGRRPIAVQDDDLDEVKRLQQYLCGELSRAIADPEYKEPPNDKGKELRTDEQKAEWRRWQDDSFTKVQTILGLADAKRIIHKGAWYVLKQVFKLHEKGYFVTYKREEGLQCSKRVKAILQGLRDFPIIRLDVLSRSPTDIQNLVLNPNLYVARKITNMRGNRPKNNALKEITAAKKAQADGTAATVATTSKPKKKASKKGGSKTKGAAGDKRKHAEVAEDNEDEFLATTGATADDHESISLEVAQSTSVISTGGGVKGTKGVSRKKAKTTAAPLTRRSQRLTNEQ